MKKIIFVLIIFSFLSIKAQDKPKLAVGIVIDQMRQEYLYRFEKKFSEKGFRRLIQDGFMLKNANFNFVPTYTGPGHAAIYSGTTPAIHGIIGNNWFDKIKNQEVYCVEDERQKPVGNDAAKAAMSPWRLLSSTITDELKLGTQKRSKVFGISIKDRGAILPAGHMADGAYWFDSLTGKFISSTFYKPNLPQWLDNFNNKKLSDKYLDREWNTLKPIADYTESGPDDSTYEDATLTVNGKPTFPYKLNEIPSKKSKFDLVARTAFGSDLLTELAIEMIESEQLGQNNETDFLAISYSSPDYIGHAMGPNSVEIEDAYLRLDKNLEDLLEVLDKKVGSGKYIVFLTADHGVADVPQFLKDNKMPAGDLRIKEVEEGLKKILNNNFPDKSIIKNISNNQIFLNHQSPSGTPSTFSASEISTITEILHQYLMTVEGISNVYSANELLTGNFEEIGVKGNLIRGFNHKRSGDLAFVLEPNWIEREDAKIVGTTHGSGYTYDTHVPVLFYGWGIKKGSSVTYHPITDIAPTLSILLKIKFPSGCTGQPIGEALKE